MFSRKFLFTSCESHFWKVRLDLNCHTVWQFKLCQNGLATTGNNSLDTLIKLMIESSQHSSHVKDKIKLKFWCCLFRRKDREETPRGICPTFFLSSKQKRVASRPLFFLPERSCQASKYRDEDEVLQLVYVTFPCCMGVGGFVSLFVPGWSWLIRNTKRRPQISKVELWWSLAFVPNTTGFPSMYNGLRPSLTTQYSPSLRSLMTACRREIFQAGPSKERSTSTRLSAVDLPTVICFTGKTQQLKN